MAIVKTYKFRPLLDVYIRIPFVTLSTSLMNERYENMTIEYIALFGMIWKWEFRFRLYNTWQRRDR